MDTETKTLIGIGGFVIGFIVLTVVSLIVFPTPLTHCEDETIPLPEDEDLGYGFTKTWGCDWGLTPLYYWYGIPHMILLVGGIFAAGMIIYLVRIRSCFP